MPSLFDNFSVGDVTCFERRFTREDFMVFSNLSGDVNPLHCDEEYALTSRFGRTIVPLHLLLAPLSSVAGMVFPGEPSLYLGHEVRANLPVHYQETVRYSARIEAVNVAQRVLSVRVLILRGIEIVLDAMMRVQATTEQWSSESTLPIWRTIGPGRAIVTGASGAIGGAIALELASRGWALVLQDRGDGPHRESLRTILGRFNTDAEFISADLATDTGCAALTTAIVGLDDVEAVVHAASPGLKATLKQLVDVNYSAFKKLSAAVLPKMLARQKGGLLMIGSTAILRAQPGWEDYAAAKTMAAGYIGGINNRFSSYGVRGLVVMPGYVATPFSDEVRGDALALLPQEVAVTVAEMLEKSVAPMVVMEDGRRDYGNFGFTSTSPAASRGTTTTTPPHPLSSPSPDTQSAATVVTAIVCRILRLPPNSDITGGGVGLTPGWDSLRQIEVILALESELNIQFDSTELTELGHFDSLRAACQRKISRS